MNTAVPSWAFSFAVWALRTHTAGALMVLAGYCRNSWWLVVAGRALADLGGLVLAGLNAIALSRLGQRRI